MARLLSLLALAVVAFASGGAAAWAPAKHDWPAQFDAPFGLTDDLFLYFNRPSHFYYDWTIRAQRIHYPNGCLPFITGKPCDLVFNNNGTYLLAPEDDHPCCLLIPDVGAVRIDFLEPFNYTNNQTAEDFAGNKHFCYHWESVESFAYWTDAVTGNDIKFKDGPTGAYWQWGNFSVRAQNTSTFALPSPTCQNKCFALGKEATASDLWHLHPLLAHQQGLPRD